MIFKKADWINNTDVYEVNIRQYTNEGSFNAFANPCYGYLKFSWKLVIPTLHGDVFMFTFSLKTLMMKILILFFMVHFMFLLE